MLKINNDIIISDPTHRWPRKSSNLHTSTTFKVIARRDRWWKWIDRKWSLCGVGWDHFAAFAYSFHSWSVFVRFVIIVRNLGPPRHFRFHWPRAHKHTLEAHSEKAVDRWFSTRLFRATTNISYLINKVVMLELYHLRRRRISVHRQIQSCRCVCNFTIQSYPPVGVTKFTIFAQRCEMIFRRRQ